jgi:2-polyprenyl-3-methyl-5-hydroxy-6-metoxy-1,4-benzoquinol methylase
MLRTLINGQVWLSNKFDRLLLPTQFQVDGNRDFVDSFAPRHLGHAMRVYDVGSGRHPLLNAEQKARLGARVIGLDIDADELAAAPSGCYDEAVCADVRLYRGNSDGDLVICQALLEHVNGVDQAFHAIASMLKPGGTAIIFAPSRNAVFARLNLVLPADLKRRLLFTIFPKAREGQGFKSYYDRCTPADFRRLAREAGLEVTETVPYYTSSYFTFFFPLHVLWRLWVVGFRAAAGLQAAETFCMALRKDDSANTQGLATGKKIGPALA